MIDNEGKVKIWHPSFTSFCQNTSPKVKRKSETFELSPAFFSPGQHSEKQYFASYDHASSNTLFLFDVLAKS